MAISGTRNGGDSLSSSLTDLMTSLMVIFILLLVATWHNAAAKVENTRNLILDKLSRDLQEFAQKGVSVEKDPADPLGLLVVVPVGLLNFNKDSSELPDAGNDFLLQFTPRLAGTACNDTYKKEISSIVVEGHTDTDGTDEINLPLSQRRALSVVQKTLDILGRGEPTEKQCFLDFLSANGRGSKDWLKDADGKEDKPRSRRVVFKIRVRSFEPQLIQITSSK
jgi:outer membrane protein OmpA-like peptidoglycan-associated protein